jgi:azurin
MRKLKIIFNIDKEPICQNEWNIDFNKKKIAVEKNMDELAYKSSNKKSKPVKLEKHNTVYTEAKLQKNGAIYE